MPTSLDPRSSTPSGLEFPLHRLNTIQTKLWIMSEHLKRQMASNLARMYHGGVGVLSATQRLIAKVDPKGRIQELPPPHHRFEMWQIANRPQLPECPCASFFDPEVGGEWRERGENEGHHPFCQFDRTAQKVFVRAGGEANSRRVRGGPAQERPDEWLRIREDEQRR